MYIYINIHRDMVGSIFIWLPGFPWGFPMKIHGDPNHPGLRFLAPVRHVDFPHRLSWKKHHPSGSNWQDFFRLERGTI
jgi:hypothetical protein